MDDAEIDKISDAVAAELNAQLAADWERPGITAVVSDAPIFEAEQLKSLHVSVYPIQTTMTVATRGSRKRYEFRHEIHIDLRKRTDNTKISNRAQKALLQRMAEYWLKRTVAGYPAAQCLDVVVSPAFQADKLVAAGIFASAAALTLLVVREASA